jgi:hypothetical protein
MCCADADAKVKRVLVALDITAKVVKTAIDGGYDLIVSHHPLIFSPLRAIDPDVLIEFRQTYVGPVIRKYGNMFRVGDCPADPIINRTASVQLRCVLGNSAVHSDMLMWSYDDTPAAAAKQISDAAECYILDFSQMM